MKVFFLLGIWRTVLNCKLYCPCSNDVLFLLYIYMAALKSGHTFPAFASKVENIAVFSASYELAGDNWITQKRYTNSVLHNATDWSCIFISKQCVTQWHWPFLHVLHNDFDQSCICIYKQCVTQRHWPVLYPMSYPRMSPLVSSGGFHSRLTWLSPMLMGRNSSTGSGTAQT